MDTFDFDRKSSCHSRPCTIVCMTALIREVCCHSLLVFDLCTCHEFLVCTPHAKYYTCGAKVTIRYDGEIDDCDPCSPPTIHAICITRVSPNVHSCDC